MKTRVPFQRLLYMRQRNAAFFSRISRVHRLDDPSRRCCDAIGLQMQPSKDASPELRSSLRVMHSGEFKCTNWCLLCIHLCRKSLWVKIKTNRAPADTNQLPEENVTSCEFLQTTSTLNLNVSEEKNGLVTFLVACMQFSVCDLSAHSALIFHYTTRI